jgi:hypothetical protein
MPFLPRVLLVSLLLVVCCGRQLVAQPGRIAEGVDNVESFLRSTKLEYYVSSRVRDTSFSIPGYDGPPRIFLASDRVVRGACWRNR